MKVKFESPLQVWFSRRTPVALAALALVALTLPSCIFHPNRGADVATNITPGEQPDRILYQKA